MRLNVLLIFILMVFSSLTFAANESDTSWDAKAAFSVLDKSFVDLYNKNNQSLAKTRPVLIINGFDYELFLANGKTKTFNSLQSPFDELKAVSHVGPTVYSIAYLSWSQPKSNIWKQQLEAYLPKLKSALDNVDSVDWSNPAWPGKQEQLKIFVKESLQLAYDSLKIAAKQDQFTQEHYKIFASHYLHTMLVTMYLADLANTTGIIKKLQQWKHEMGEQKWEQLFILVMGSKGRSTAGLTINTNTAAFTISKLMTPANIKTHLIIMPFVTSEKDAFITMGQVINSNALAQTTFLTQRAKQATGLFKALQTPTIPLAMANVKHIVLNALKNKPIVLPKIKLLDKDRDFLEKIINK